MKENDINISGNLDTDGQNALALAAIQVDEDFLEPYFSKFFPFEISQNVELVSFISSKKSKIMKTATLSSNLILNLLKFFERKITRLTAIPLYVSIL